MVGLILTIYFVALGVLAAFGLHRLRLTALAARASKQPDRRRIPSTVEPSEWPKVCVQLPVYNEALVATRLLRAAAALDYPRDRLTIQVLDDSADETQQIVQRDVDSLSAGGAPIVVVRRPDRAGFKAGALAHGLSQCDADLVAIFDADFVPEPDFLKKTVPALVRDPALGMVQARWGHLNQDASWLTRAQAVFLDAHFGVEHRARAFAGECFNFNGTAGVWRRAAIERAGGWQHDTITEDLDLSYRAQLAGCSFAYLDDVVAPAELPERWSAFRTQQARWVRGSAQTARKLAHRVARASEWPLHKRVEALVHLSSNVVYLLMALLAVLLPPAVVVRDQLGWRVPGGQLLLSALDLSMLTAGTLAVVIFYAASMWLAPRGSRANVLDLLFALCLGAGMSLSNGKAVISGLFGKGSEFIRTPKSGGFLGRAMVLYKTPTAWGQSIVELVFALYFAAAIVYAVQMRLFAAIPFLGLYFVGFAAIGLGSLREEISSSYLSSSRASTSVIRSC